MDNGESNDDIEDGSAVEPESGEGEVVTEPDGGEIGTELDAELAAEAGDGEPEPEVPAETEEVGDANAGLADLSDGGDPDGAGEPDDDAGLDDGGDSGDPDSGMADSPVADAEVPEPAPEPPPAVFIADPGTGLADLGVPPTQPEE